MLAARDTRRLEQQKRRRRIVSLQNPSHKLRLVHGKDQVALDRSWDGGESKEGRW